MIFHPACNKGRRAVGKAGAGTNATCGLTLPASRMERRRETKNAGKKRFDTEQTGPENRESRGAATRSVVVSLIGDPGRIRTCDLQLRRLLLYPLSYGAM
jgi:hypothetical protein